VLLFTGFLYANVAAQTEAIVPPSQDSQKNGGQDSGVAKTALFLSGAAVGLLAHEAGHLAFDVMFDADPYVKRVEFHGIPFFALSHRDELSPRREVIVASAGFWVQHATDEWILTRRPRLKDERAPFAKGMLAFNVLTSMAYASAAFAKTGPFERDTRAIADGARIDEAWVGAIVLAPAVLDSWRYLQPESRLAVWLSRSAKIGMFFLVFR
jgi:hypothetical protein